MKEIFLGEFIRQRRLEEGLTQEQLCEGICEPMTISRLERGKQTPSRNTINAILQRLGLPDDRYYALLSKNEVEISNLEKEIVAYNIQYQRSVDADKPQVRRNAMEKLRQLEQIMNKDDMISRQLILRSKVLLGGEDGSMAPEEKLENLLKAIRLTSPRFDQEEINSGLYTDVEIKIINQIASFYGTLGDHYKAIDILKQLIRYIQHHLQSIPADRAHVPMITFNYARELSIVGRYRESINVADEARLVCIQYGHYQFLPSILAVMAKGWFFLGDPLKSEELYRQSYYVYKVIGDESNRLLIQSDAKELLNLELS